MSDRSLIILVNDDAVQLRLLSAMLGREGMDVHPFTSAEAALAAMASLPKPDLVVTDLHMPGIDGWRFCRLLRSPGFETFNQLPILVVSATFSGDEVARITTELGADAFMSFPASPAEFVLQVRAILGGDGSRCRPSVLLVEDSLVLMEVLVEAFTAGGYRITRSCSVGEAALAISQTGFDVAVLDYHLPDGKGDQLLEAFRERNPDGICIMATTDPSPDLALGWMNRGAAAYVRKPFAADYLLELCAQARRERVHLRVERLLEARTRELRVSEAKYRSLVDFSSDLIFAFNGDGTFQFVNAAFVALFGCALGDLAGKTPRQVLPPEDAESLMATVREVIGTGGTRHIESRVCAPSGEVFWFATTASPVRNELGETIAVSCVAKDMTDRKRAEERLREALADLNRGQQLAHLGSWRLDLATGAFRASEETLRLFGFPPESRPSLAEISRCLVPADRRRAVAVLKGMLRTRQPYAIEVQILRRGTGETRTLLSHGEYLPGSGDLPSAILGTNLDITERRLAEAARAALEAQNRQLQKAESLGRMAGAIAHHFNNQLQAVMANLDLALAGSGPRTMSLRAAQGAARRAADVSSLMLTYLGQGSDDRVPLDFAEACRCCLPILRSSLPGGTELDVRWPDPGPVVRGSASQLQQVLTNLVNNAWEAGDGGPGVIRVAIRVVDPAAIPAAHRFPAGWRPEAVPYAVLEVQDTGSGIAASEIEKVFDPFYSTRFAGRGLGLSVVLGIVRAHGGGVTVESETGRGSRFRVFLPLCVEEIPSQVEVAAPPVSGSGAILLVDDEPLVLTTTADLLELSLPFKVLTARDGRTALGLLRQHRDEIRCVLCDLTMPGMDGWETIAALRELRPGLPVVLVSGYDKARALSGEHAQRPQVFLGKPFGTRQLVDAVQRALAEAEG